MLRIQPVYIFYSILLLINASYCHSIEREDSDNIIKIQLIQGDEIVHQRHILYNIYNAAFTEIYKNYLSDEFLHDLKKRFDHRIENMQHSLKDMLLFIAYYDEEIVGFSLFKKITTDEVSLELIAIAPQKWRCGIGKKLVFAIHGVLPSCAIKVVTFTINTTSPHFYTALGFEKTNYKDPEYNPDEIQGFEYKT